MDEQIRSTLSPVLDGRFYIGLIPAGVVQPRDGSEPAPYGISQRIGGGETTYLDHTRDTTVNGQYQIDLFGREKIALNTVAAEVKTAMNESAHFSAVNTDERDGFEDAVNMFRISLDYSLWRDTA